MSLLFKLSTKKKDFSLLTGGGWVIEIKSRTTDENKLFLVMTFQPFKCIQHSRRERRCNWTEIGEKTTEWCTYPKASKVIYNKYLQTNTFWPLVHLALKGKSERSLFISNEESHERKKPITVYSNFPDAFWLRKNGEKELNSREIYGKFASN